MFKAKRYNFRMYGKEGYASYIIFNDGIEIGSIEDYCQVVSKLIKQLNVGKITLDKSGIKAINGEFFSICCACGNIHSDGTRGNC